MVKAVVFDVGGVLVDLDMDRCIRAFREELGFSRITEVLDPCHQKGVFEDMEAGRISADDFRAAVLRESRPGAVPADVDRCLCALLGGVKPESARAVLDVAQRYPIYLLSNNNPISMPACLAQIREAGVDPALFKDMFVSAQMKMLKPSAEFYREVIRRIDAAPEEIVFIDDSPRNVDGALAVGIDARLFVPGTSLAAILP
jgi:haloacid dehalogenase superfamily, subfamily IA, variant 3 with third motif having DD or ED